MGEADTSLREFWTAIAGPIAGLGYLAAQAGLMAAAIAHLAPSLGTSPQGWEMAGAMLAMLLVMSSGLSLLMGLPKAIGAFGPGRGDMLDARQALRRYRRGL